jgi:hypothetical protein
LKSEDGKVFDLLVASAENDASKNLAVKSYSLPDGVTLNVTAGDMAPFMQSVVAHMEEARKHVGNDN